MALGDFAALKQVAFSPYSSGGQSLLVQARNLSAQKPHKQASALGRLKFTGPFDNETEASLMHQQAATDYGWAGPFFVKKLLELDESQIISIFDSTQNYVRQISQGKNGAHIAGISVVTLADILIDMIFFNKGQWREAVERARAMAKNILLNQVESNATDVNENALQFIVDWILANQSQFGSNVVGTCFGFISENGNIVYILPSYLNEALKKAGFSSPRKIIKYLAEQKLITTYTETSGKKTYTVMRWFNNRSSRFIEFHRPHRRCGRCRRTRRAGFHRNTGIRMGTDRLPFLNT